MALGDVLDRDPGFGRQRCRALPHPIAQRLGKLRVIEDADAVGIEKPRHPLGVADHRQRPGDHHPVVAGQHPGYPIVIAFRQRLAHGIPRQVTLSRGMLHQTYWFRLRRLRGTVDRAGRNVSEHRAGLETANVEADPP